MDAYISLNTGPIIIVTDVDFERIREEFENDFQFVVIGNSIINTQNIISIECRKKELS